VLECVKRFGAYEGYLYVDSGVTLDDQRNVLSSLYQAFHEGQWGMLAARTDTDTGMDLWFKQDELGAWLFDELHPESVFTIPVGKAVNLHLQIFSNELLKFYGRLMPDIFASFCTESTFSFLPAALGLKWGVYKNLITRHIPMMDGQSAGFSPPKWAAAGRSLIDHPFKVESIIPIMVEGHQYGLGYEEIPNGLIHDPAQYDQLTGSCINPKLKDYIKENMFLPRHLLDYYKINSEFIDGK
jgi:hypothetical protein